MSERARVVTVIPGDGIGPEVIRQALATLEVLDLGLAFEVLDHVNAGTFSRTGEALSDDDMRRIRRSDGVLLGAIGDPAVGSPAYAAGVLLRLRRELDLFVNHRPARLLHDRLSPLRRPQQRGIDCVIVRENTEGLYCGLGGILRPHTDQAVALDAEMSTHFGVARVMAYAFSIARRGVCLVDKANAVPFGGDLWQFCWRAEAARHSRLASSHLYADAAAMALVSDPARFDVIVTNNSYGDILSDLAAVVAGGLGLAPSMNLNADTGFGLYEPVHGSAPDIAGKGIANPFAAILCAAMLVERLGHPAQAAAIRAAVSMLLAENKCTPDLGGGLSTEEVGAEVRVALRRLAPGGA